jgi:hypothetical protein
MREIMIDDILRGATGHADRLQRPGDPVHLG